MSDLSPDLALREAQRAEYSAWVANKPIDINGARAFNVGDPVPASHVKNGVVSKDAVNKPDSKAGADAMAANPTTGNEA